MLGTAGTRDTRSLQTFHCADSIQDFFKLSYAWFMRMHYWQKKNSLLMLAKVLLRNEKRIQTAMFVKVDTILHRKPTSPTFNIRNQSVFGNNFAPCELYEVILCRMYKVLYAEMRNELFL